MPEREHGQNVVSEEQSPPRRLSFKIAAINAAIHLLLALGLLLTPGIGRGYLYSWPGALRSVQDSMELGAAAAFCLAMLGISVFAWVDVTARKRTSMFALWGAAWFMVACGLLANRVVAWHQLPPAEWELPRAVLRRHFFATSNLRGSTYSCMALCAAALMLSSSSIVVLNRALRDSAAPLKKLGVRERPTQRKAAILSVCLGALVVTILTICATQVSWLHQASLVATAVQVLVSIAGGLVFQSLFLEAGAARAAAVQRQCASFIGALAASHLLWSAYWLDVAQTHRWGAMDGLWPPPSEEVSALLTALDQMTFLKYVSPWLVGLVVVAPLAVLLAARLRDSSPSRGLYAFALAPIGVAALAFLGLVGVDELAIRSATDYHGFDTKAELSLPIISRAEFQTASKVTDIRASDDLLVATDGIYSPDATEPPIVSADSLIKGDCSSLFSAAVALNRVNMFIDRSLLMRDVHCVIAGATGTNAATDTRPRHDQEWPSMMMLALDFVDPRLPKPYAELMGETKVVQMALAEKRSRTHVTVTPEHWLLQTEHSTQTITGTILQRGEQLEQALFELGQDVTFSADPATRWDEFASAAMRYLGSTVPWWIDGISDRLAAFRAQEQAERQRNTSFLRGPRHASVTYLSGRMSAGDTDGFVVVSAPGADREELKRVLQHRQAMAASCIRRGRAAKLRHHPDTVIELQIGKDGTVETRNVVPEEAANATTSCILSGLMSWTYPTDGTAATVFLRLVFGESDSAQK